MPKDARTRGIEALAELYPDPTVRAARTEELGDAGLLALGNQVLRQDDYSRQMNDVNRVKTEAEQLYTANQAWWEQRQADLEELDRLRAQVKPGGNGTGTGNPDPKPDPAKPAATTSITKEEVDKIIADTERGAVAFFSDLNQLSLQHFQQFGEILDTNAILTDRRVQQIGIRGVYQDKFAPQLKAKADATEAARVEAIRQEERAKIRAEFSAQQHPYPIRGNDPSTLDGIQPNTSVTAKSVDEMAVEYSRLAAARSA